MATLKGQLFARLALDYADHPKVVSLSDPAFRAHVEMILYARRYETDGRIPKRLAETRWGTDSVSELLGNDLDAPSLLELPTGDYLLHGYADMQETRAEIAERRQVNRQNGRKGGRPRKTQSVSQSVSQSAPEPGTEKKAETETETDKQLLVTPDGMPDRVSVSQSFDEWWEHWPKKVKKAEARAAFPKALKALPLPELIKATDLWVRAFEATGSDRKFMPGPEQFLKHHRWEDDLATTHQPAQQDELPSYWR